VAPGPSLAAQSSAGGVKNTCEHNVSGMPRPDSIRPYWHTAAMEAVGIADPAQKATNCAIGSEIRQRDCFHVARAVGVIAYVCDCLSRPKALSDLMPL
jgi:hypothetical protein